MKSTRQQNDVKICVDCVHHKRPGGEDRCYRRAEEKISVVTGDVYWTGSRPCYDERGQVHYCLTDVCGKEGKYFKEMPRRPAKPKSNRPPKKNKCGR